MADAKKYAASLQRRMAVELRVILAADLWGSTSVCQHGILAAVWPQSHGTAWRQGNRAAGQQGSRAAGLQGARAAGQQGRGAAG